MTIMMSDKINGLVLSTSRSCRNKTGGSTSATFKVDFTGCTIEQVLQWALSSRVISGQRVWEKWSGDEITTKLNDKTLVALHMGKQPADPERAAKAYEESFKTMSKEDARKKLQELMKLAGLDNGEVEEDDSDDTFTDDEDDNNN